MDKDKKLKIFIIEDNKIFALLLKSELENSFPEGAFVISIFESGEDCEGMIYLKPDLAIVDYHLDSENKNGMTGLDLIDMIRKRSPDTDFIMVTMDEKTELFLRSKERGIHDYLTKSTNLPFKLSLSITHWLKLKH